MQRGQDFNSSVKGELGGVLDFHGDNLQLTNVTNINVSDTGSRAVTVGGNESGSISRGECGYVVLGNAIGSAQAAGSGFALTLPTPERGLWYKFILRAPSVANNNAAEKQLNRPYFGPGVITQRTDENAYSWQHDPGRGNIIPSLGQPIN